MMYYAIAVFVLAYAFIISERFNKTTVALVGAGLMVFLPVMDSPDVFYSQDNGIDWDVIFLMLGMMMIVSILRQTGVFEYVAIWAVKRANGSPLRIMMLLMVVMAFASAILPNVVSVLLIAPVTLLVCDALEINPVPLLMAEVFASNVGGAATLVGDPPNIIIGARKALSFNAFLVNMAPIVVIVMLVLLAVTPVMFRGLSAVSAEKVADVMSLQESDAIRDRRLLIRCGVVMVVVLAGFIVSPAVHIAPSLVALLGAGILILTSRLEQSEYLSNVEWDTLLFMVGLFIMVGGLFKTGVIKMSGRAGSRLHRRQRLADHHADPGHFDAGIRFHRQRPLRGDDDADRQPPGLDDGRTAPPPRAVVVAGAGRRLGRQPDRRRIQRQHRHARHRLAVRQSHLFLGIHPQGHRHHHDLHRAMRGLFVAPLLRPCVTF